MRPVGSQQKVGVLIGLRIKNCGKTSAVDELRYQIWVKQLSYLKWVICATKVKKNGRPLFYWQMFFFDPRIRLFCRDFFRKNTHTPCITTT
jgi:hypothetical protein